MGKIMERRYKCKNGVIEKTRFVVGDNTALRPRWRKAKSTAQKREENKMRTAREVARLLNNNVTHEGFFVMLDYAPKSYDKIFGGMDEDQILLEGQRQGSLFMRRLKRYAGPECKCLVTASDREEQEDGTLVPCRIHNHVVVMGATEEQIRKAWKLGTCTDVRHLYRQQDYTPLAVYMIRQVRSLENAKKYRTSGRWEKPVPKDRVVIGDPTEEIRVQTGAKVLDRKAYQAGTLVQYVRYIERPKAKRGGHKEGQKGPDCGSADEAKRNCAKGGTDNGIV